MIRIESVHLENFLSHEKTDVVFKGHTAVIVGPNGAGKSSVLDGILFGLYRETGRNANQDEIIKKGRRFAKVVLRLTDGIRTFEIVRSIGQGASITDLFRVDNVTKARSAKEVSNQVVNLLGLDKDTLTLTLFVVQGNVEDVLEQLDDVFRKVVQVEKLEKLRSSDGPIKEVMDEVKEKLTRIETDLKLIKEFEEDVKKLEMTITEKASLRASLTDTLTKLRDKLTQLEQSLLALEAKREAYIKLNQRRKDLEREIQDLQKFLDVNKRKLTEIPDIRQIDEEIERLDRKIQNKLKFNELLKERERASKLVESLRRELEVALSDLKRKRSLEDSYNNYLKAKTEMSKLEQSYQDYVKLKAQLESKRRDLEEQKKLVEGLTRPNVKDIESELERTKKLRLERQEKIGSLKRGLEDLNDRIRKVSEAQGTCPLCGSPLTEIHKQKLLQELNEQLESVRNALVSMESELKEIERRIRELESAKEVAQAQLHKFLLEVNRLNRLQQEVTSLKGRLEGLEAQAKRYEELKTLLEKLEPSYREYLALSKVDENTIKAKEERLVQEEKRLNELNASIQALSDVSDFDEKDGMRKLEELKSLKAKAVELLELRERVRQKEEELRRKTDELAQVETKLKDLMYDENEYLKVKKELELTRDEVARLEGTLRALEDELSRLETEKRIKTERLNELRRSVNEYDRLAKAYEKLRRLRDVLSENRLQAFLFVSAKEFLERVLNEIANTFDLKYTTLEIAQEVSDSRSKSRKAKLVVYGYTSSGEKIPTSLMSGGERVAVALALRMAFARLLSSNVGFVVLDEPTVFLDEYRKRELLEVIRKATNLVPQIILVTHDSELKDVGDQVISVTNEKGTSSVKVENLDQ